MPYGNDIFQRNTFEISDDRDQFQRAMNRDVEDVSIAHGADPVSPGEFIRSFYKTKPKSKPSTETEARIFNDLLNAPVKLEYISNFLIYSKMVHRLPDVRARKALWSLVRGGAVKAVRTYRPNDYWLLANP